MKISRIVKIPTVELLELSKDVDKLHKKIDSLCSLAIENPLNAVEDPRTVASDNTSKKPIDLIIE